MDRYERLRVLGRGSFGVATLVRKRRDKRESKEDVQLSVVKEVDLRLMSSEALQETMNEVSILKSLSHVNIVAYRDTFCEDETMFIVMEHANDGDLFSAVQCRKTEKRRFGEVEALSILLQCGRALRHIHARHIVHRDLKSHNIFLTDGSVVKIGDFGIAKVLEHTRAMAKTVIGTPSHLAPEVCENKPYGTKADMWSLGVVFYEVLSWEPPFKAMNLAALCVKIVNGEPKPLPEEAYSSEVRGLLGPMLKKDPASRPSASKLLRELPLRQTASLSCLPSLAGSRPSSGSISEVETLTPASQGDCGEVPTPRSQEGVAASTEPSPREPCVQTETPQLLSPEGMGEVTVHVLTELDVLAEALGPSTATLPSRALRESPSLPGLTQDLDARASGSAKSSHRSGFGAGFRRSISTDARATTLEVPSQPAHRPPQSSSRRLPQQRPRPVPLGESSMEQAAHMDLPIRSPAVLQSLQLPALKVTSMPPTPSSDGAECSRTSSSSSIRRCPSLQPLTLHASLTVQALPGRIRPVKPSSPAMASPPGPSPRGKLSTLSEAHTSTRVRASSHRRSSSRRSPKIVPQEGDRGSSALQVPSSGAPVLLGRLRRLEASATCKKSAASEPLQEQAAST